MRRVVCILGLLCVVAPAIAIPLEGSPDSRPPPHGTDVELTGEEQRVFDYGLLGTVAAKGKSRVTIANHRCDIVIAEGHATVLINRGTVAGIRSTGDAQVTFTGGIIAEAGTSPGVTGRSPVLRASGRSKVLIAGGRVSGPISVSDSAILDIATSPHISGADPQLSVSDDAVVHLHGRDFTYGRSAGGRSGYFRISGTMADRLPLSATVRVLGRGKIVLHDLDGRPEQTIGAVGIQPSTRPSPAVATVVRTTSSIPLITIAVILAIALGLALLRYRLASLVSLTSLLLFAGVAALWLRSYRHADTLTRHAVTPRPGVNHHHTITWQSAAGGLRLHVRSRPAANGIPEVHRADLSTRVEWEWRSTGGPKPPAYPITADDFSAAGPLARKWRLVLLDGSKPTNFSAHPDRQTTIVVPLWLVALPLAVPPPLYLYAVARRRRRVSGDLCRACRYDLRASTGRCPECGTAIKTAESAPSQVPRVTAAAAT